MEKYEHKLFVLANGLNNTSFSEPLQKEIVIFERMYAKLKDTVDEDREDLLGQLDALDSEILQDMEEEFEDKLQNNQLELTNEDILEHYYKKKRNVALSELRNAGFKGDWKNYAGDYWLERVSVFSYQFRVRKKTR